MHRYLGLALLAGCATDAIELDETAQEVAGGSLITTPAWIVKLDNGCSASILDERWLMTADHCVTAGEAFNNVFIVNGPGGQSLAFTGLARGFKNPGHPGPSNAVHDIGLIYLESAALDLGTVLRAKLYADPRQPWSDLSEPDEMAIAGWGLDDADCGDDDVGIQQLRLGTGLHVDFNPLNDHYASAAIGAVHACGGDSGAPYLLFRGFLSDADFLQFAVHSGRRDTTIPPFPFPSMRHQGALLADNVEWIESTIAGYTSGVFSSAWQDGYHNTYHYRRSVLSTHGFDDFQGFGYRCMTAVGSLVEMRTCDGSQSQRWSFELNGNIRLSSPLRQPQCLTLNASANRTQLTVTTCAVGPAQRFWYDDVGRLRTARDSGGHKCIEAGGNFEGAHVQVFDCNGTAPQMWLP